MPRTNRGAFYDTVGTLRDVVQSHLLQVLALVTMEPPGVAGAEALRDKKNELFRAITAADPQRCVRGQYEGYTDVPGVAPQSDTETFVALRLEIGNWRWAGVPIFLRAGKALAERVTEVRLVLRRTPRLAFLPSPTRVEANQIVLRIDPEPGLRLQIAARGGNSGRAAGHFVQPRTRPAPGALRAAPAQRTDRRTPVVRPRGRRRAELADRAAAARRPPRAPHLRAGFLGTHSRAVPARRIPKLADPVAERTRGYDPLMDRMTTPPPRQAPGTAPAVRELLEGEGHASMTAGTAVPLTACLPHGPRRSGVVVLHEMWGLTPSIERVTAELCTQGYAAAAPHLYHRQGEQGVTDGDARKAQKLLRGLSATGIECDVRSAIAHLSRAGATRIGILGFSMGASLALWAAANTPVAAAVGFYGGGIRRARWRGIAPGIELAGRLSAPWIGFYGDKDRGIPVAQVEQLRTALAAAPVPAEVIRYPNAAHAFASEPAERGYAAAEAADAWRRTHAFLAEHLG